MPHKPLVHHKWVEPPDGLRGIYKVCSKCSASVQTWQNIPAAMAEADCPVDDEQADVVVALENMQAAVEQLEKTTARLQSIVQMGFGMHGGELYSVEARHIDRMKIMATRLQNTGALSVTNRDLRDIATDIMEIIRYAETLHELRKPGEPYVHMTPKEEKNKP